MLLSMSTTLAWEHVNIWRLAPRRFGKGGRNVAGARLSWPYAGAGVRGAVGWCGWLLTRALSNEGPEIAYPPAF